MAAFTVTVPGTALVDESGEVTPAWRAFFVALQQRTGGSQGVDVGAMQAQLATETAQRTAADQSLHSQLVTVSNAGASTAASLNAAIAAETSARAVADSTLLPKNGGTAGTIGFQGTAAIGRPTVSGSKAGNAALASLLTALSSYGLVTDTTT